VLFTINSILVHAHRDLQQCHLSETVEQRTKNQSLTSYEQRDLI